MGEKRSTATDFLLQCRRKLAIKRGKGGLRKTVEKTFFKLAAKNREQLERIHNKIEEIRRDPHRYKNMGSPLQHLKRVHIDKSYVLIFSVDDYNKLIIIEDYDHHDRIYRR